MSTYDIKPVSGYEVTERDDDGGMVQTWTFNTRTAAVKFVEDMEEADRG